MRSASARFSLLSAVIAGSLLGCTSYEEDPVEPAEILRALEEIGLEGLSKEDVAPVVTSLDLSDGLSLLEASAIAVRRNPNLLALRADVGVAEAQLIQAGLLSDPVVGWDFIAAQAGDILDKIESPAWVSGLSLTWQVPRPGEIDSKEGVARAQVRSSAAHLAGAEWRVVRDVHIAYARLLVARARLVQIERLAKIAQRSLAYFAKARAAGAATALEEGLARVAADTVQVDVFMTRNAEAQAQQTLNRLLGLPPDLQWALQDSLDRFASPSALSEDPKQLVRESLERRPDLQEVLADYQQAEEQVRLECARQWPQLEIGTGFSIQIPIFSQFNQPAIKTALRSRAAARLRVTLAVQQTRAEIHSALVQSRQAYAALELFERSLGPQTEETLRLTERAFQAREVTPLEILTAQRQVLDTQSRFLTARQSWAEARIQLDSACGRLLPSARTPLPPKTNDEESQ
ncbi:MAG: TolC family protein [Planctomycetes bacterium]|nr:TolC family protein [Planctomycetota bacterium]